MLKKINGVTGEVTMVPTPNTPPKTKEEWVEEFEETVAEALGYKMDDGEWKAYDFYGNLERITDDLRLETIVNAVKTLLTEKDKQREEAVAEVKKAERERLFKRVNAMSWEQKNETEDAIRILKELYNFLTPPTN